MIMETTTAGNKLTTTLLENWVEERQCQNMGLEEGNYNEDGSLCSKLQRQGHKGLLTTHTDVPVECSSSSMRSFVVPVPCGVRTTGMRAQLHNEQAHEIAKEQVQEEIRQAHDNDTRDVMISTTTKDYHKEYQVNSVGNTVSVNKSPTSFWMNNKDIITGVTGDSNTFSKNSSFSTPVEHRLYQE